MKALTYEQRLTAIFETERKAKAAAARKLDTAKEECKHTEDQAQAEAVLHSAEQAHAAELSAAEEKARSAYTTLRAELAEKVRKASLVNPDDVEPLALELLESGVMKADDFAALAEHYSENPTMLWLVSVAYFCPFSAFRCRIIFSNSFRSSGVNSNTAALNSSRNWSTLF